MPLIALAEQNTFVNTAFYKHHEPGGGELGTVVRLLGLPKAAGGVFELEGKTIVIDYSDGPCETSRSGRNVPRDAVVRISMTPTKKPEVF